MRKTWPFFRRARIRLQEMGDCQARPQHRPMATIEYKQLVGEPVRQAAHDAPPDIFACPCGAEPVAFEAQECNLIEWIDRPQARIEFEAIDDPHRIAEPDMLRPQVAMSIDDATVANAISQHGSPIGEKPALDAGDAPDQPRRQAEASVEQHSPIVRQALMPIAQMDRG